MSTVAQMREVSRETQRFRVAMSFALVYFFWGSTYLAIRIAVRHFPAAAMGSLRFTISGVLMLAWCALSKRRIAISLADGLRLAAIGVLLLTGGNVVLAWAEESINSGLAAMIVAVVPIWIAVIEGLIGGHRLKSRGWMGLALGIGGLVVLLWPDFTAGNAVGRRDLLAAGALMFGSLSWAIGSVISHHAKLSIDPFAATGWEMLFAGIVNTAISFSLHDFRASDWSRPGWLAIAYLVTFGSLVGFTAYIWLLEHVPTPKVATYAYVNPVVAVFLGWLLQGERFDRYIFIGMIVIVGAVMLVTTSKLISADSVPRDGTATATHDTDRADFADLRG